MALHSSVGIMTLAGFREILPSGTPLPATCSDTFSNSEDNQKAVQVILAQKDSSGTERQIASVVIEDVPPYPQGYLQLCIALEVSDGKELRLVATTAQSGLRKEFGPFRVE
jgi:molecular chaperone DnaK (HSP70)